MDILEKRRLTKRHISFARYAGLIVVIIGIFVLAGWIFDIPVFKSMVPGRTTMKVNTALAFVLAGTSLWLISHSNPSPARIQVAKICSGLVLLIGFLTLGEYLFGRDFGIDQLLFRDVETPQASFPGRMAFASALCFVLIGIASLFIRTGNGKAIDACQYLAVIVLAFSLLAFVGYVYDVQALYRIDQYSSMSLHTAAGFVLLAFGTLSAQTDRGWMRIISTETAGGAALRRMLPFVLGIPVFIGWLVVWGDRMGWYETHFGLAMISVLTAGFLVITLWLVSRQLNRIDIDRKQVEEALHASQQHYRNVLDRMLEGAQIIGYDWRYLYVNDAAAKQGRETRENLLGQRMMDVYPGIEHTELFTVLEQCMSERISHHMQNEFTYPDGEKGWFELSIQPVQEGLFILSNDITERKQAEEALRKSEERFRLVVEALPSVIIAVDQHGKISLVNAQAEEVLGYHKDELLGEFVEVLIPEHFRTAHIGYRENFLTKPASRSMGAGRDLFCLHNDGHEIPVEIGLAPYESSEGLFTLALIVDITERKQAELALLKIQEELEQRVTERTLALSNNEARFRGLFEYAPVSIWEEDFSGVRQYIDALRAAGVTDVSSYFDEHPEDVAECAKRVKIVDVNRATLEMYQAENKAQLLADLSQVLGSESLTAFKEELLSLLRGDMIFQTEITNYTLRGEKLIVFLRLTVAPSFEQTWGKVFVGISDITKRRQAEAALRESEQRYRTLFEASHRQAQELALLDRVRQALAREVELPLIFRTVVEGIAQTFGYTLVSLYLVDSDVLTLQHQVGYDHVIERIPLTQGVAGQVVRSQQPVLLEDVRDDPAFLGAIEGITSEVCVPLFDQDQVAGVLNVESIHGVKLSKADLHLMIALGDQIGIALGRARLYSEVRENEQRFRQLAEHIDQVFWLEDSEHSQMFYISPAYETIWGRTPGSLYERPQSWFDLIHPDDQKRVLAAQAQKVSGEYDIEYRVKRLDGSVRWVWSRAFPIQDEHGHIYRIAGIAEDITERKHIQDALREAEIKYRALVEQLPAIVYLDEYDPTLSAGYRAVYMSPQVKIILGYHPEEFIEDPDLWPSLLHPDDRQQTLEAEGWHYKAGEPLHQEYRVIARDGQVVWLRDEGVMINDEVNGKTFSQGVLLDITARKQAEEALRKSEERFRLISWATKDASWDWDLKTDRIFWGTSLQKVFHYSAELTHTDSEWWHTQIHPKDRDKVTLSMKQALEGGMEFWSKEYRFQRADGTYADIMDRGYILRDGNNEPYRMIGAMMDITERRQAEATILHHNEMLSSLYQITIDLLRHREINPLLNALVELAAKFMDAPHVEIMLVEDETLVVRAVTQTESDLIGERVGRGEAVLSWQAVDTREPAVLRDYQTWPYRRAVYDTFPLHAVAEFPILNENQCLGVLALGRDQPGYEFTFDQIQYGRLFANLTALVLDNAQLREALREQSIRDPLTGLYNRRYMEETLKRELSRVTRQLHPLGIIMLDIDHFKHINDTYGHVMGDALLRELGQLLKQHIRHEDIACRYGGEEFVLIMPDASLEVAQQRAEHLREDANRLYVQDEGQSLEGVRLSLGVAIYPQHGRNMEAVLRAADVALYRAKQEGRNRVVVAKSTN